MSKTKGCHSSAWRDERFEKTFLRIAYSLSFRRDIDTSDGKLYKKIFRLDKSFGEVPFGFGWVARLMVAAARKANLAGATAASFE
jgi:hypothetical protein